MLVNFLQNYTIVFKYQNSLPNRSSKICGESHISYWYNYI